MSWRTECGNEFHAGWCRHIHTGIVYLKDSTVQHLIPDANSIRVQINVLIEAWTKEWSERVDLKDGMYTEENRQYQQGYADAIDRCIQALRIIK